MKRTSRVALAWLLAIAVGGAAADGQEPAANFFASRVVQYSPGAGYELFPDPLLALGGPRGRGWLLGSLHVVTLGVQGELVLGFEPGAAISDAGGADFIVSENPFGTLYLRFAELVRVGVSTNGVDFAFFPTWCGVPGPVGPYGQIDPDLVSGFAGVEPVHANVGPQEEYGNDLDPFDPEQAGGDVFDLADLAAEPAVVSGAVDLSRIYYLKLTDALGDGSERDSFDNPVYDPAGDTNPGWPVSADIDAVSVIHGLPLPRPGDATRDGAVDGADYTLWADHFERTGMTWEEGDFNADGLVNGQDYTLWADNYDYPGAGGGGSVPAPPALLWLLAGGACLCGRRRWLGFGHGAARRRPATRLPRTNS